ncbi:site-specific integrase [Mycoplasmopsis sturni]|uniref:site-specific integrase n=1 Tax=Mycoplasmopsis sturni TaxID=39047 RepID=UPI000565139D|nr:site-specific integrase [Mycoplasmopsis sturni]
MKTLILDEALKSQLLNSYQNKETIRNWTVIINKYLLNKNLYDYESINEAILCANVSTSSKALYFNVTRVIFNKLNNEFNQELDKTQIKTVKQQKSLKRLQLTKEQHEIIEKEANAFSKGKTKYKILIYFLKKNICRISEAIEALNEGIDSWEYDSDYDAYFKIKHAKKNGNPRPITLDIELYELYKKHWKGLSRDRAINFFKKFNKYLQEKYPEQNFSINSHIFRTDGITTALINGVSVYELQQITGHKSPNTLINHYLKPNLKSALKATLKITGYTSKN